MEITGWFGLTRGRALTVESILVQGTLQAGTWGSENTSRRGGWPVSQWPLNPTQEGASKLGSMREGRSRDVCGELLEGYGPQPEGTRAWIAGGVRKWIQLSFHWAPGVCWDSEPASYSAPSRPSQQLACCLHLFLCHVFFKRQTTAGRLKGGFLCSRAKLSIRSCFPATCQKWFIESREGKRERGDGSQHPS